MTPSSPLGAKDTLGIPFMKGADRHPQVLSCGRHGQDVFLGWSLGYGLDQMTDDNLVACTTNGLQLTLTLREVMKPSTRVTDGKALRHQGMVAGVRAFRVGR